MRERKRESGRERKRESKREKERRGDRKRRRYRGPERLGEIDCEKVRERKKY